MPGTDAMTSKLSPDALTTCQRQLLERAQFLYQETPISDATIAAFLATPRHRFVFRYRKWGSSGWHEVTAANGPSHLATLYADDALILAGDDDDNLESTISQPSFVLRMLDLLQLHPDQTVFELGAGSGWNAALMGHLVGSAGRVYSLELHPEVAARAQDSLAALGIVNVHIIVADGGEGYAPGAPYDRAIFTAGSYDLPRPFYAQLREGGLLLLALKNVGGADTLFLLRKHGDHFSSEASMLCGFLQLRGKHQITELEPGRIDSLPEWAELQHREIARTPFWWGGKGEPGFTWRTIGLQFFLAIADPGYRAFKTEKANARAREQHYFGLWDSMERSLVLAKDDWLIAYGTPAAQDRLVRTVHQWVDLGMPSAASFTLQVYPSDMPVQPGERQWMVKRRDSQFLWSLEI